MQKSRLAIPFLALVPLVAACGGDITVLVLTDGADAPRPVVDLEVQFLPFDRDSLFAVLGGQASTPEPQISAELRQAADSVLALQEIWSTTEGQWNAVRDSLRGLSDRLQGLDPRSRDYRELFDRFGGMEGRERSLNRRRQDAFDLFTSLQQDTQDRLDSMRVVIESWEDVAFADYPDVESALLSDLGREVVYDTTGDDGYLRASLSKGDWWVYARVRVPSGELYWNVLARIGAIDTLRLEPGNAQRRMAF